MTARLDFATRFQRLLALLRYAAARGDDGIRYDELAGQFGLTVPQLVRELETAAMVGADDPHYDRMPFEVVLDDDLVRVRLFSFGEPLRLTPQEALHVVAAARAVAAQVPSGSALDRALTKVADVLGLEPDETIGIDADPFGGPMGRLLDEAVTARRLVRFRYWSYGRDEIATRTVDPWQVFTSDGAWYLAGSDVEAVGDGERRFRLDRMSEVELLDDAAGELPARSAAPALDLPGAAEVRLELPSTARWVVEHVPTTSVADGDDGRLVVDLAVTDRIWLERLLLRIGPGARVIDMDERLGDREVLAGAATRILARYRDRGAGQAAR